MRARAALPRALILGVILVAQARAQAQPPEYQVKAAFLYKFATYIRWPSQAGVAPNTPFVIGVIGKDPFGSALDAVIQGQKVVSRPIVVRRLSGPEEILDSDVLFVCSSERGHLRELFEELRGAPVLTVSDIDQFAEMGGMINLVTTEDNQIRFDINKEAVDRAGLKAASQLLRLARIVESRSGSGGRR